MTIGSSSQVIWYKNRLGVDLWRKDGIKLLGPQKVQQNVFILGCIVNCALEPWQRESRVAWPHSPVKRCDAQSYLNPTLSAPSPSTSPHANPAAKNHVLQFTDSALSSSLPGQQPDEKVDVSLSVNLITSGPTGRMSSIIAQDWCTRKMSWFFQRWRRESTVWRTGQAFENSSACLQPLAQAG